MARQEAIRQTQKLQRAHAFLEQGNTTRAGNLVEEVLARNPDDVNALRLSALIARSEGKLDKALDRFVAAARQDPSDASTMDAVNAIASALDRMAIATEALELAVIADPTDATRHARLAEAYFRWGKFDEALGHARLATTLAPNDAEAWAMTGSVLLVLEQHDAAYTACQRSLTLSPGAPVTQVNAALALDALGRADEARRVREHAAQVAPDDPLVAFHTKDLARFEADDPRIDALERHVADAQRPVQDRVQAGLTLAKAYDDIGRPRQAAQHLVLANERWAALLDRRAQAYDPAQESRPLEVLQQRLSDLDLQPVARSDGGPVPIVILGLPRSGKTLLETRLAASSDVLGLGERPLLPPLLRALSDGCGVRVPDGLDHLDEPCLQRVHDQVLSTLLTEPPPPGTRAMAVTNPGEFAAAPLLALCDARTLFVHVDRDPRDLLLSNYLQFFPVGQAHAYTVPGLVHRFQLLERYCGLVAQRFGSARVVRVSYEELVTDPAAVLGTVRAAAGLPARANVPDPARSDVTEVAASPAARPDPAAPLHAAHVGFWRRWEADLPELFAAIDEAGLLAR